MVEEGDEVGGRDAPAEEVDLRLDLLHPLLRPSNTLQKKI